MYWLTIGDLFTFDEEFTRTLYHLGTEIWNGVVSIVSGLLVQNPQSSPLTSNAYTYVVSFLNNATLKALAISMIVVFFLFDMTGRLIRMPEHMDGQTIIFMYMKIGIAGSVVEYMSLICSSLIRSGCALANLFQQSSTNTNVAFHNDMTEFNLALDNLGFLESIIMCILSLVYLFVLIAAGFNLMKSVIQMYTELLSLIPFAPIATGTITGGQHISQVGMTYIKSFIGKCLVASMIIILMCISGYIGPVVVTQIMDIVLAEMTANDFTNCLMPMLTNALTAMTITSAVSGANMAIKNNLGL